MANTDSANFSPTFKMASADTDLFDSSLQDVLPAALDTHDHSSGKGTAVKRVFSGLTAALPAAGHAGYVYVATDSTKLAYYDEGVAWHSLVTLDQTQTLVAKTLTAPVITGGLTTGTNADDDTKVTFALDNSWRLRQKNVAGVGRLELIPSTAGTRFQVGSQDASGSAVLMAYAAATATGSHVVIAVPNGDPGLGALGSSNLTVWLDEVGHTISFHLKDSAGNSKTATLAYV